MQVSIESRHVAITNALSEYVRPKIGHGDQHFDPMIRSNTVLLVARNRYPVETAGHIKSTQRDPSEANPDMCVATNPVADNLDHRVLKHEENRWLPSRKRQVENH